MQEVCTELAPCAYQAKALSLHHQDLIATLQRAPQDLLWAMSLLGIDRHRAVLQAFALMAPSVVPY